MQTLSYDANGNLTSDGQGSFGWDAQSRLVSATGPGLAASYAYDADGRRIAKSANGTATTTVWDGGDIIAEYDSSL